MTTRDPARTAEMMRLRNTGMTLDEIGAKYCISRERVRQLIGNTGKDFLNKLANKIQIDASMKREDVKGLFNGRRINLLRRRLGKMHHALAGGYGEAGQKIEHLVSEKLSSLGFENELMPIHHPFDIRLKDGKRIDVKATWTTATTSKEQKHEMYRFSVRKNKKVECDYFICYIAPHEVFFVIPQEEISETAYHLYIAYPEPSRSWSKWLDFENRFDLLRNK